MTQPAALVSVSSRQSAATAESAGDPVTELFRALAALFNNQTPTLNPRQWGQSSSGVVTGDLGAVDPDSPTLTYTVTRQPLHGTVHIDSLGGTYTYTPDPTWAHMTAGEDVFTVRVSDAASGFAIHGLPGLLNLLTFGLIGYAGNASTREVRVTVTAVNHSPTITVTTVSEPADDGAVTIGYTVSDPDNTPTQTLDTLMVSVTGTASTQSLSLNGDGTLTYVPTEAARTAAGPDTTDLITVTVTDGHGGSATATATVSITPLPPSMSPVAVITATDPGTGAITGAIVGGTATSPLTYTVAKSSLYGTATIDAETGEWTFKPNLSALVSAWSGSTTPTTTFTAIVSDGQQDTAVTVVVPLTVTQDALIAMLQRYGSTPSAVAVGADGTLYVANSGANTVSVITGTNTTTVSVGRTPQSIAVDSNGYVWVVNSSSNTVSVLTGTGQQLTTVAVGAGPARIAFGSDGTAYVTNAGDNTVSVIGSPTSSAGGAYAVHRTITVGQTPIGITAGPDGRIFVANYVGGTISIIDPADDYTTDSLDLGGVHPYGITVAADGTIYVTDPNSNTVTQLIATQVADPGTTVITNVSGDAYAPTVIAVGQGPTAIATGSDGSVYVADSGGNTVTVIDPQNPAATTTFETGANPVAIANGPAGTVYVADSGSDTVTVVNTDTRTTQTLDMGVDPNRISVGHNGELIIDANGPLHVIRKTSAPIDAAPVHVLPNVAGNGYQPALAVDASGNVYIARASYFTITVDVYNPSGELIATGHLGNDFAPVGDMVVSRDGRLYVRTETFNFTGGAVVVADVSEINNAIHTIQPMQLAFTGMYSNGGETPAGGASARGFTIGADGRIYVVTQGDAATSTIVVLDPDDYSTLTTLPNPTGAWGGIGPKTTVGPDGRIYISSWRTTVLTVIDPSQGYAESTVDLGAGVLAAAIAPNGQIFVSRNDSAQTVVVLNPDLSTAAELSVGFIPTQMVTGPDGKIYAPVGAALMVINPWTYDIGTVDIDGYDGMVPVEVSALVQDPTRGGVQVLLGGGDGLTRTPDSLFVFRSVVANVAAIPAAVHSALSGDSAALALTLGGLAHDMENVMTLTETAPGSAVLLLKVVDVINTIGDLQTRVDGIANGDVSDFLIALLDVAELAIAVIKIPSGPGGVLFGVIADATIIALKAMVEANAPTKADAIVV